MGQIECLKDCKAFCCKKHPNYRVEFYFTQQEAGMFAARGVVLTLQPDGGYTMPEDCIFLNGKLCVWHGLPNQPECCVNNIAGGGLCLEIRASVAGKRYSEVE